MVQSPVDSIGKALRWIKIPIGLALDEPGEYRPRQGLAETLRQQGFSPPGWVRQSSLMLALLTKRA
jgi:hypothetical protein